MATLTISKGIQCQFQISWVGQCSVITDNGWCNNHEKLRCVVCGKKATHDCDTGMGGLICGCPLCDNCTHSPVESNHITNEEALKIRQRKEEEQKAAITSRTSPVQRKDGNGIPLNLFELLKNPVDYTLQKLYYLELVHGLMGFFPADIPSQKRMVVTEDKSLLKKVWLRLEHRDSKMSSLIGYVGNGYAFLGTDGEKEETERMKPVQLLTTVEFTSLCSVETIDKPSFGWAFGLIGGKELSEQRWNELVSAS
jgi:hypothetical protein